MRKSLDLGRKVVTEALTDGVNAARAGANAVRSGGPAGRRFSGQQGTESMTDASQTHRQFNAANSSASAGPLSNQNQRRHSAETGVTANMAVHVAMANRQFHTKVEGKSALRHVLHLDGGLVPASSDKQDIENFFAQYDKAKIQSFYANSQAECREKFPLLKDYFFLGFHTSTPKSNESIEKEGFDLSLAGKNSYESYGDVGILSDGPKLYVSTDPGMIPEYAMGAASAQKSIYGQPMAMYLPKSLLDSANLDAATKDQLRHTDTSDVEEHGGTEFTLSPEMIGQAVAIPFPPFRLDGDKQSATAREVKQWIAQGVNTDPLREENDEARKKLKATYNQA